MGNYIDPRELDVTEEEIEQGRLMLLDLLNKAKEDSEDIDQQAVETAYKRMTFTDDLPKLLVTGHFEEAGKYFSAYSMGTAMGRMIGTLIKPDGSKEVVTEDDFLDLLEGALEEKQADSSKEALQAILKKILDYAITQQDLLEDPVAAQSIEGLQSIYNWLIRGTANAEDLDKFFKGQKEFMAIPRPAGIEDLLAINQLGSNEITLKEFDNGNKVTFSGRLSIDEQKINEMIRLAFTANNPYKAKTGVNTLVEIPFTETMEILCRAQTEDNKKKFARQLRKEMLPSIAHQHLEIKAKDGTFVHMEVGGGYFAVNRRKDRIYFKISDPYAAYINTGALSQYNSKTLRLGTQKKPLAFYLAIKLQDHYFMDGNRKRATNNILNIKTLLNFCKDMIPTYEYVQATDRGHWVRQIRQPLEAALNEIQTEGLFEWEYCKKGLAEVTPQEIRTNDYRKWSGLYITFKLIPEEPDQTERLAHKQERIEAAAAKKAAKDAENIVKADKIQKRNSRRKKGESATRTATNGTKQAQNT